MKTEIVYRIYEKIEGRPKALRYESKEPIHIRSVFETLNRHEPDRFEFRKEFSVTPDDKDLVIQNPDLLTATKVKAEKNQSEVGKKYDLTDDGTGKKYDTGKSMVGTLCSVFPRALLGIGRCIEFGTHKYPKSDNWKLVENAFARYQDSLMRHYLKFLAGEVKDRETGLPHLMHVGWNALAILELFLITNSEEYDKDLFL